MIKKYVLSFVILLTACLNADIIEIDNINEIRPYVIDSSGLVFLDIDDTLITTPFTLGRSAWRVWAKESLTAYETKFNLYEALTLFIAVRAPYIPVEDSAVTLVSDLQAREVPTFAFTARGKTFWYDTFLLGMDRFTEQQLNQAGFDFTHSKVPNYFSEIPKGSFYNGIIFNEYKVKKGDFLVKLFKNQENRPAYIIFVDDKLDQVKSVEKAAKELGIPYYGFWYKIADNEGKRFNPMIANVQLRELLYNHQVVSDETAREMLIEIDEDPKAFMKELLDHYDLDYFTPEVPYQHDKP